MQLRHADAFTVLFLFSIFRPAGFLPDAALPVGPLAIIWALFVFLVKIGSAQAFLTLWQQYKTPVSLVVAYTALCVLSLFYNYDRYDDVREFLRWGAVFIIGQSFVPLCVFIFLFQKHSLPLPHSPVIAFKPRVIALMLMIPLSVFVQVFLPNIFAVVSPYVVGGDLTDYRQPIRGILATSTDLGAISAILCWLFAALSFQTFSSNRATALMYTAFAIIFALGGALSESRNFILFLVTATLSAMIFGFWAEYKLRLAISMAGFISFAYWSAYFLPDELVYRLGFNIPHFMNVAVGAETSLKDLLPQLSTVSLNYRGELWASSLKLIVENPLLGVSNGGFRLSDDCFCQLGNTHNIILQSAVDAGIPGTLIICTLLVYLIMHAAHDAWFLPMLLGVIATLLVDNFTDHSFVWIVIVTYVLVYSTKLEKNSGVQKLP